MRIEGQRLTADLEECYPDYEFAFEAEDDGVRGMYYRCERTRELQAEFGDMLHRIHDLEAGYLLLCFTFLWLIQQGDYMPPYRQTRGTMHLNLHRPLPWTPVRFDLVRRVSFNSSFV